MTVTGQIHHDGRIIRGGMVHHYASSSSTTAAAAAVIVTHVSSYCTRYLWRWSLSGSTTLTTTTTGRRFLGDVVKTSLLKGQIAAVVTLDVIDIVTVAVSTGCQCSWWYGTDTTRIRSASRFSCGP